MEKMKMESPNLTDKNIDKIEALFPNCITETADENGNLKKAVNFEMLRAMLSEDIAEGDEAYEFTWVGKKAAIAEANRPIRKTLRPCPEESVDWDNTENLYIEGDNLEVLKLLQESYLGKVKMIYIDPPYNTGKDFVYKDNYKLDADEYDEAIGVHDENGNKLFLNPNSAGRYHSDWCSMMYSRLLIARNFLTDDGVIFISIDDHECSNLIKICNEVFGESCFVCSAIWRSSDNSNNDAKQFSGDHNYTLIYSKQPLWQPEKKQDDSKRKHFKNPDNDPKGPWFDGNPLNSPNYRENLRYTITAPNGNIIQPPTNGWRWSKETLKQKMQNGEIYFNADQTNIKRRTYLCEMEGLPNSSLWIDLNVTGHNRQAKYEVLSLMPENVFDTPKPVKLLKYIISLVKDNKNAIIMDFFSGSGTTADAIMQLNAEDAGTRKYILVQLPEDLDFSLKNASNDKKLVLKNAISLCDKNGVPHLLSEVAKERIRRAGKDIVETQAHLMNAVLSGAFQKGEAYAEFTDSDKAKAAQAKVKETLDVGFRVFKLDETNMEDVYYTPAETDQQMLLGFESNIKPDRTDLDLLFGCLLEWGLPLSMPYKSEQIDGVTVHTYNDGDLIACFDKAIPESAIKTIAKRQPLRVVFRDDSFADSSSKINVGEIFKMLSPDTRVKVI